MHYLEQWGRNAFIGHDKRENAVVFNLSYPDSLYPVSILNDL